MSLVCNTKKLSNVGSACKLEMQKVRGIMFVARHDSNGDLNKFSIANSVLYSAWETLFNTFGFSSNVLAKVEPMPTVRNFKSAQEDAKIFNEDGYMKKTSDGAYAIEGEFFDMKPYVIKKIKELEGRDLAFIPIFDDGKIGLMKKTEAATDFYPIPVGNTFNCANFNLPDNETISREKFSMNVTKASDMNNIVVLDVLDGSGESVDFTDDEYVYSLVDATIAITSPATTGCIATIATEKTDNSGNTTAVSGAVYTDFVFYDQAAPAVPISLAGAGSLTESPNGTYTINEATLLTSSCTYDLKVSYNGYDIAVGVVVVP